MCVGRARWPHGITDAAAPLAPLALAHRLGAGRSTSAVAGRASTTSESAEAALRRQREAVEAAKKTAGAAAGAPGSALAAPQPLKVLRLCTTRAMSRAHSDARAGLRTAAPQRSVDDCAGALRPGAAAAVKLGDSALTPHRADCPRSYAATAGGGWRSFGRTFPNTRRSAPHHTCSCLPPEHGGDPSNARGRGRFRLLLSYLRRDRWPLTFAAACDAAARADRAVALARRRCGSSRLRQDAACGRVDRRARCPPEALRRPRAALMCWSPTARRTTSARAPPRRRGLRRRCVLRHWSASSTPNSRIANALRRARDRLNAPAIVLADCGRSAVSAVRRAPSRMPTNPRSPTSLHSPTCRLPNGWRAMRLAPCTGSRSRRRCRSRCALSRRHRHSATTYDRSARRRSRMSTSSRSTSRSSAR